MDTNKFKNKNGDVSHYALICGYIQRIETGPSYKELFMEHSHFHVKSGKIGERWSTWETYDTLTPARKEYRYIKIN